MNPPADPTPPPMPPTPTDPRPQYEFDETQNKIIDSLANSLVWVRIPVIVSAIITAVYAVMHAITIPKLGVPAVIASLFMVLVAVLLFLIASWLLSAAVDFSRVTHTTGYDITHLMSGLQNLAKYFGMLAAFIQAYLILLVVMLVFFALNALFGWLA